jgi:hypothetical protein
MERGAVVEPRARQVHEVLDGARSTIGVELDHDVAAFGLEAGLVLLRGIERAGGRRELIGHGSLLGEWVRTDATGYVRRW